jgi:hypothetical protein
LQNYSAVLVSKKGVILGIITKADLLRMLWSETVISKYKGFLWIGYEMLLLFVLKSAKKALSNAVRLYNSVIWLWYNWR